MVKDPKPLSSERVAFLTAVGQLDDEGFTAIAWMIYQQAKTAGGFGDHEGWYHVLGACEALPEIRPMIARFRTLAERADRGEFVDPLSDRGQQIIEESAHEQPTTQGDPPPHERRKSHK